MFYCKVNTFIHKFTISTIKILFCDIFFINSYSFTTFVGIKMHNNDN